MRVVFMGTPEFAVPSLEALAARHDIVAVYTRPDAVRGRGSGLTPSPVKEAAERLGVPVREPRTLRDESERDALIAMRPDLIVVAAYGLILPPDVLAVPALGAVNVHASLLPRWRGAAPVHRAILAGDTVTGVSIMRMEEGLDTGPFCAVAEVAVDDLDVQSLTVRLAEAGASALLGALPAIEQGTCQWTPQDERHVTYAEKVSRADVALEPALDAEDLLRRVRASGPSAPARLVVDGRSLTALSARSATDAVAPGTVEPRRDGLLVGTADSSVLITHVKPDGKGAMAAGDWARGARIVAGATWTADR